MGIGLDDMFQYDMLARSLADGNGYRWYAQADLPVVIPYLHLDLDPVDYDPSGVLTSFRPPLYPAFLALVYFIFGVGVSRFFIARLVQAVLAASLAPMTYKLALLLIRDKPVQDSAQIARRAAWIITLYPMLIIYPLSLATENLFFVLILSAVLVLLIARSSLTGDGKKKWVKVFWFAFAGVLLGMSCLTRSVALIFAGLTVVWVWFILKQKWMALVVSAAIGVVIIPWMVRNSLLYGKPTGIETALGYDLYVGYYPSGTGTFQYPQSLDLMTVIDDYQRDTIGMEKAWEFIKANPSRVPYLALRRAGHFFGLERRAITYFYSNDYFGYIQPIWLGLLGVIFCLPFILTSISGIFGLALSKRRAEFLLLVLFLVGYLVPHLFITAEDRFHLAILPFLAVLAAVSWTSGLPALRTRWQTGVGKFAILAASFIVVLLIANWGLELWRDADKLALLFGPAGNTTYFSY